MQIQEFLNLSIGKWFCQRTSYLLNPEQAENSKSEITISELNSEHPEVVRLCQKHDLNPQQAYGGIKAAWDNSVDWGKPKANGFSVLVVIPDGEESKTGKALQQTNQQSSLEGSYIIGNDDALTLMVETPDLVIKERIWFPSDNLRMRTCIIQSQQGWSKTSFYSEIRKLATT
jgi:phycoerythrin-associated linker protein